MFNCIHHTSIICSDYIKSKHFYTQILGLTILRETYRTSRKSYKLDLALNGNYVIELFSFPETPPRLSRPEATGLRHIAFETTNIFEAIQKLKNLGVKVEEVRIDEFTNKKFTFLSDPDKLPIEIYEK